MSGLIKTAIEGLGRPDACQWAVAIVTFKGHGSGDAMRCVLASGGNDD